MYTRCWPISLLFVIASFVTSSSTSIFAQIGIRNLRYRPQVYSILKVVTYLNGIQFQKGYIYIFKRIITVVIYLDERLEMVELSYDRKWGNGTKITKKGIEPMISFVVITTLYY